MNPETLKYLKNDEVGKVIAMGLANLYACKPQKPVQYLGDWLKNFSHNEKQMRKLVQQKQARQQNLKLFNEANEVAANNKALDQKKKADFLNEIQTFKNQIAHHEYQHELLQQILPQFIEKHASITGAYVGQLNYPSRSITDEDTDENAHLNTQASKLIKYIGSSLSHKELMRGQVLGLEKGVTGQVFGLQEKKEPVNEEGQEPSKQEQKKPYVYVKNVVKNDKVNFFRIPKLGAYLAIPLVYDSFLTEDIFDDALDQKLQYLDDLKEFNKKKEEQLNEFNLDKEDADKKLSDLKEKNADEGQIEEATKWLKEIEAKIQSKSKQSLVEKQPELTLQKRSYVICVDNLGMDEQLRQEDIKLIEELVNHFKESWQKKQCQLLRKDIKTQVQYLQMLSEENAQLKESLEKELELDEQTLKEIQANEDEKMKLYKREEADYNKLKSLIQEKEVFVKSFLKLKEFRVVKYRSLIQNILHFLGCSKAQINEPNKAILNWKHVRANLINNETFNKILAYVVEGPKEGAYNFYCKTTFLSNKFEGFNEDEIFEYNAGLALLTKFIKKALKHRLSNVELRKAQKQIERTKRQELINQNEKITEQKGQELEKVKSSFTTPEELENFPEEEWIKNYDETHQLKEVPAEILDDIDNDV